MTELLNWNTQSKHITKDGSMYSFYFQEHKLYFSNQTEMKIFVTREISGGRREIELLSLYVYQKQTLKWKLLSDSESSLEEIRHKQSQSGLPPI